MSGHTDEGEASPRCSAAASRVEYHRPETRECEIATVRVLDKQRREGIQRLLESQAVARQKDWRIAQGQRPWANGGMAVARPAPHGKDADAARGRTPRHLRA